MRLNISHRTVYRYDGAPFYSAQILRLTPRTNISQHVLRWRIDSPGGLSVWSDAFGNTCHTHVIDDPPEELVILAQGEVVTSDVNGVLPAESGDLPLEVFLRQTPQTQASPALSAFAREYEDAMARDRLDALHRLMAGISERVEYKRGGSDVESTAAEAFEAGRGVCQDHAHIFIAAARELRVPARYVSGYLYDFGAPDSAASHAWAAAWIDGLGWVSFDVSNGRSATEVYVSIAVGLDYDTASPIRGTRTGGNEHEGLEVSVSVSATQ